MTAAVEFKGVSKSFGDVVANSDISFSVKSGSIHAIVGENGAGKSTAMKILFGLYQAESGSVTVHGKPVEFSSPLDAMENGIGMVHQHFMLAEPLTALDNLLLQTQGSAFSLLPRAEKREAFLSVAARYGFQINLDAKVGDLSVGEQQRLEILKTLAQNSNIIILDEPTAVLTPLEAQDLFKNLRTLRDEGKTIIIITHKLKEVLNLTDHITVFRNGKIVGDLATKDASIEQLTVMMIGHGQNEVAKRTSVIEATPCLEFKNVTAKLKQHSIHDLSFTVHRKEIVGIAGVEGNGQDILLRRLLDEHAFKSKDLSGHITVKGKLAALPEDRLRFGVLSSRPLYENFLLGQHRSPEFTSGPFINFKALLQKTREVMKSYDVRPLNESLNIGNLSGGNQQKLVVARALSQKPDVIIAAQPTRGVDIGAIEFIHSELRRCRDEGAGVLLISSELDELIALSDRILVIYKGRFVLELARADFNEFTLGKAMGGAH